MKKTMKYLCMAALLMAGAAFTACSNSDDIISEQPANTDKQGYTLTISASKDGSATRALDLDGSAVVASWETTDEIVVSKNGTQIGTLSPTDISGLDATFTGTISGDADINVDDVLTLTYHPIDGLSGFASQNGTLNGSATSAENFDMAIATVTISGINGKNIIVSESSANFVNQTAVVVLSPYNSAWSGYHSLTSLTVLVTMDLPEVGTVTEKIGPITVTGDQPHYFSLPSQSLLAEALAAKYSLSASAVSTLLASATVTFTGHQVAIYYLTCSKTGYKFAAGKYYKLDNSNFSMTMLDKYAAADKDVYVSSSNTAWSNTVTFAVNREIGWKVEGDYVYCGDKQLYVEVGPGPLGPDPYEGFVKATEDHIPFGATYSLRDPEPAGPTAYSLAESTVGMIVGSDGNAYAAADKDNLPTGVTAVAMVAYKSANAGESLAIALSDEDGEMNWSEAKSTCEGKAAIGGYSWKLPTQGEWGRMFAAFGGDEDSYNGLNTAIENAGGTALEEMYVFYWSSTPGDGGYACGVYLFDGKAYWPNDLVVSDGHLVRACLAF